MPKPLWIIPVGIVELAADDTASAVRQTAVGIGAAAMGVFY